MDNVRLLKNLYDAFGHGDVPTVLGSMSPDIRWHQAESNPYMPSGDAFVGPDAVLNNVFMKLVRNGTASLSTQNHSTAPATASSSKRATAGMYKATGKSIDAQVCHVWDVKDGKVTRFQQ